MNRHKLLFILLIIGLGICSGLFAQVNPGGNGAVRNTLLFEDFGTATTDWPVAGWTQRNGLYPTPTGTTAQWFQDDWLNVTTPVNKAAKINIYGTLRNGWLVTPAVTIPAAGYEIKFDLGLTQWNQTTPILDPTAQQDDKFIVVMSDSAEMTNPVILREWNNTGSQYVFNAIPHTGTEVTIFLTGITGTKYFAFYGESTVSGGDNDLMIDNVHIRQTPTSPQFFVQPSSKDFGQLLMGTSASQNFIVRNTGIGTLVISSINLPANPNFTLSNVPTLPANLAVGEAINFTATFAPATEGQHNATISITDNLARVVNTVPLSGSGFDATITTLPATQTWDSVTVPAIPVGWSKIVNSTSTTAYVQTSTTAPFSAPNCVQLTNSADADAALYLVSPPIAQAINMNSIRIRMQAKGATGYLLQVGTMSNPADPTTFSQAQELTVVANWNEYVVNLSGHTAAGRFIAFRHGLGSTYRTIYIDNVTMELIAPNDLAAVSITGNATPSVGAAANYTVRVLNNGTANQSTYQVKLFNATNNEIASVAGPAITAGQTADVVIPWTPTVQGAASIYGKVVLAGDVNPANDQTPPMNISVQPEGINSVTVGAGGELQGVPWEFYFRNSLFQTLYYQDELSMFGNITALSFYNNFTTNLPNMPVKLWLGTTNLQDLSAGWIDPTSLTLVYDGNMDFPTGANTITVPLQTPFTYSGGNLVLYAQRPMDTQYYSSLDDFQAQTVGTNRARKLQSDSTEYDAMAPSAVGTLSGTFPKTTFIMTPLSPDPIFTVTPPSKNFGQLILGTTASQNFTVLNVGGGTLTVNTISISGSPFFSISNMPTLPAQLSTGQNAAFTVVYAPTAAGDHSATVTITDNMRATHTVALSGNGFDATITTLPSSQTWDAVTVPALPLGWSKIVNSTSTTAYVQTSTTAPFSTPNCVQLTNSADATAALYLISPPIAQAIDMSSIRIRMMAKGAAGYLLQVGTMSNPTDPTTFSQAQELTVVANWNEYVVNLTGHTAAGRFIAFRHGLGATYRTLYIDDLSFEPIAPNDLAAIAITGNTTPPVNSEAQYLVSVLNNGTAPQSTYQVKLFNAQHVELASVAGAPVAPGATVQATLSWTPTEQGLASIYGKVVLPGDANPANDSTNPMNVNVTAADVFIVEVGSGTDVTGTSGVPTPYGTFYKNFRQQFLYTSADLIAHGAVPGAIYALAFNVQGLNTCVAMPNYRIRMKNTAQTALTTTFEVGEYTQVWQHPNYLPEVGWNMHVFTAPFFWDGTSNVIIDILTDLIPGAYTQNAGVYYSPTAYVSSLRYQSDSVAADTATTGTTASNRSNTRFYLNVEDMGSLTGTVTENGVPLRNVVISIGETVFTTTTNNSGVYNFSHAPVGTHSVTASKPGYTPMTHSVTIVADQQTTQNFAMVGNPAISISNNAWNFGDVNLGGSSNKTFTVTNVGGGNLGIQSITIAGSTTFALSGLPTFPTSLTNEQAITFTATFTPNSLGEASATITITDDLGTRYVLENNLGRSSSANRSANTRVVHTIALTGNGVNDLTIGDGSQTAKMPLDFFYKASLFETIYQAEELNNFVGMITGLRFYNNFLTNLPNMPTKIWLGTTTQTNLADGWIPSTALTLVFDGTVNYPSGENTINIEFPEPFMYLDGGNLVMMAQRPLDTVYYSSSDNFKAQTVGTNRSRKLQNDTNDYDPTNPTGGTLSGQFPKTTFVVIPGGVGHITGTVLGEGSAPLAGVQVLVDGRPYSATTDQNGQFNIANVLPGNYTASFSRYGYISQNINFTLDEDETEVLNITMQPMPKVSVSGTVLASDTAAGIAGASVRLAGYANYTFTTNANGVFQSTAEVYANQSYAYTITAAGYTTATGTINVGTTNHAMGNITLSEVAYAPNSVTAALNAGFSAVELNWSAPDPNALEITESFEAATFPPADWSQAITNTGPANSIGVFPTWRNFGEVNVSPIGLISPTSGTKQAGLWWSYEHQDEWLMTPTFNCPPDGFLRFDSFVTMGSANGDHYYVKASVDGGSTWTVLWDASTQAAGENVYAYPITIDLVQFGGQQISLAFHAEDPPSNDGLWYPWFIDNIYIGNFIDTVRFEPTGLTARSIANPAGTGSGVAQENIYRDMRGTSSIRDTRNALRGSSAPAGIRNTERALTGYKVWRLISGQENNESNWASITPEAISNTNVQDNAWGTLPNGTYKWAVKAVYTNGVLSVPAFSNPLVKQQVNGQIVGFVRRANNQGIAGATVTTSGGQTATTNSAGAYSITVPVGTYSVTASATGFHPLSYENILVSPNTNTTQNFVLTPTSNEDEMAPVTVTTLKGNFPNPFNPETTISYDLKDAGKVRLDIYNTKGQLVRTLVDENQSPGRYRLVFNSRDNKGNPLASGVYLYRLRAGDYISTRKMMLME